MSKDQAITYWKNDDFIQKSETLWNIKIYYHIWKLVKLMITFGDIEIRKRKFYHSENLIPLEDADIDNAQVSGVSLMKKKI